MHWDEDTGHFTLSWELGPGYYEVMTACCSLALLHYEGYVFLCSYFVGLLWYPSTSLFWMATIGASIS